MKSKLALLFAFLSITFSYFMQGGGYNQNAIIGEIRAVVERGTFDLGDYASITGDVSCINGKCFSNKTPCVLFVSAPAYLVFYKSAELSGIDLKSSAYQLAACHFITITSASLWGAMLGVLLFFVLGQHFPELQEREKLLLSLLFPISSLLFPYSTMAFGHSFEAFYFLAVLYLLVKCLNGIASNYALFALGLSHGLTILANPIHIITTPFLLALVYRSSSAKRMVPMLAGLGIPCLLFVTYNFINFGNPFLNNRSFQNEVFTDSDNFLGVFEYPNPLRVVEVMFGSWRSLVPTQIYLLFFIPGIYLIEKRKLFVKEFINFIVLVLFVFALFIASFNGWHGGVAFGPRYITPVLALFFILSIPIYVHFKKSYILIMVVSGAMVFMVTAVDPLGCGQGVANPFLEHTLPNFLKGRLSTNPVHIFPTSTGTDHSHNIGQLMGLNSFPSLLPILLIQGALIWMIFRRKSGMGLPPIFYNSAKAPGNVNARESRNPKANSIHPAS